MVLLPVVWLLLRGEEGVDSRQNGGAPSTVGSARRAARAAGGLGALLPPRDRLLDGQPRLPELQPLFHALPGARFSGACCDAPMSFFLRDSIGCSRRPRPGGNLVGKTDPSIPSWTAARLADASLRWRSFIFLTAGLGLIYLMLLSWWVARFCPAISFRSCPCSILRHRHGDAPTPLRCPAHFDGSGRLLCRGVVHQPTLPVPV